MISIIIPLYNAQEYLRGLIDNLKEITSPNDEVIFVNDGSKDSTGPILSHLVHEIKCNYKIISQNNSGQSSARNHGFNVATSDFVCFMDADDLLDKKFKLILNDIKDRVDVDFFVYNFKAINTIKSIKNNDSRLLINSLNVNQHNKNKFMYAFLSKTIKIHNSAIIYRKRFLQSNKIFFNESLRFGEDSIFIWESIIKSRLFTYSDATIYYYINRPSSVIKSSSLDKINNFIGSFSSKLNENKDLISKDIFTKIISNYLISSSRTIAKFYKKQTYKLFLVDKELYTLSLNNVYGARFILILIVIKLLGQNSYHILRYL